MSKQKLILVDGLYQVGKDKNDYNPRPKLTFKNINTAITPLLQTPNSEVIMNFDSKKDKRRPETKSSQNVYFDLSQLFNKISPKADFVFNQPSDSPTFFYLTSSSDVVPETDNLTFTFNGNLSHIDLNDNPFSDVVINFNAEHSVNEGSSKKFHIVDKNLKHLTISGNADTFSLGYVYAKNLETITVTSPSETCFFQTENFTCPSLKYCDFSKVKNLHLKLNSLIASDFAHLNKKFSFVGNNNTINAFNPFLKCFAPDTKFHLNPQGEITCYEFLPENGEQKYSTPTWKVSELFPNNYSSPVIVSPKELLLAMWQKKYAVAKEALEYNNKSIMSFLSKSKKKDKTLSTISQDKIIEKVNELINAGANLKSAAKKVADEYDLQTDLICSIISKDKKIK